ncbi:serine protease [Roseibium sp. SCPC15]|uniref:S1 family peptidase n=1 Tax=Roseibium sp. SCP15 TaxID=3141376 RepID=UPI0033384E36
MRYLITSLIVLFGLTSPVSSESFHDANATFDPEYLSFSERRFVQAGLAFQGVYFSALDGTWDSRSQEALENYNEKMQIDPGKPTNFSALYLVAQTVIEFRLHGWEYNYFDGVDISILTPTLTIVEQSEIDGYRKYYSGGLYVYESLDEAARMQEYHLPDEDDVKFAKRVREKDFWITFAETENGLVYSFSTKLKRAWKTVSFFANHDEFDRLNLVMASLQPGKARPIGPSRRFVDMSEEFLELLAEGEKNLEKEQGKSRGNREMAESGKPSDAPKQRQKSSGTAFAVSSKGHLLTNAHVVNECELLAVKDLEASLIASDEQFDLALIHVPDLQNEEVAVFADRPAALNSDITVAGYPLTGLLSGLNVTRGSVTSLKGLGGNGVNMQISAPVQPGNSGGPAVNARGAVVGVVVAKLNATEVASAIGDIPQNVNFAIRGSIAQLFLHQNGVIPKKASDTKRLQPEEIASKLSAMTFHVLCN